MADRSTLCALTSLPTASGKEDAVARFVRNWADARERIDLAEDAAGNLLLSLAGGSDGPPLVFAAHMDHPAFVVEEVRADGTLQASFRGGVRTPYFREAVVEIALDDGASTVERATVVEADEGKPARKCVLALEDPDRAPAVPIGAIGRWPLPRARVVEREGVGALLEAPACDDLAALAAALEALDALAQEEEAPPQPVQLLLTRAEEVGFVGAVAACRLGTIHPQAQVLALECTRAFADAPLGGGVIVRVGDRLSVFDPQLTARCLACAQRAQRRAAQEGVAFRFQRRLMAGGACEATAYNALGHCATCLCLALENYHNMGDLDRVERELAGDGSAAAVVAAAAPERVSLADHDALVRLLVEAGRGLPEAPSLAQDLAQLAREGALASGLDAQFPEELVQH